jgi:hypothetical protein
MLTNTEKLVLAIKSLRPTSEFSIVGGDYSSITWNVLEGNAPTQKEITDAILAIENAQIAKEQATAENKAALLDRLGITADEAKLLLA